MMSTQAIADLSRKAAVKAAKAGKVPLIIWPEDRKNPETSFAALRRIPNLGDHRPNGWELIESHFVDKSGFGEDDEPAMSVDQFLKMLVVDHGYGIIEEGQFQIYIGEFVRA